MLKIHLSTFVSLVCVGLILQACATKPQALSVSEFEQRASYNKSLINENQQSVAEPIDLYQAMARAVKYNLNYRVKIAEARLSKSEYGLMHHSLLPKAVANANYTARNNFLASSSYNIETKKNNFGASTSQEKAQNTGDLAFSWNILDFGLSYIRAQQAGDKALISAELQNKVVISLLEEVRRAYWLAISSQRMADKFRKLKKRIKTARKNTRQISASRETPASEALLQERELVKISDAISKMQREHNTALTELAILMGMRPGSPIKLTTNAGNALYSKLKLSSDEMIDMAIRDRIELHEIWYQQRINKREAKAAMLEMLPGLNIFLGSDWSSNSFLLNSDWVSWGAKASWNLMKIFKYPLRKKVIEDKNNVLQARAMALTITVMTQVHVSRANYQQSLRELAIAGDYRNIQNKLIRQLRVEAAADLIGENDLLREELNTLIAETRFDIANANAQASFGNLFTTIGWNPVSEVEMDHSAAEVAASLRSSWQYPEKLIQQNKLRLVMK
ncbi:MAG: TolC family protein [Hyphomicrobiales bacterium]|nr:TolC family protein [Hyphomicrobiales bacterium]